ncbi:MAG: phosphatidate cytidylyltransferase [Planctomycetaceae bacterium]|jgi:phosphatidate cytidylyltransferase|nr:phosphatidate cytidylyltransferase [Planctomycetaceae bacterium]
MDVPTLCLFIGVLLLLIAATVGLRSLLKYTDFGVDPAVVATFRPRIRTWWMLFGLLFAAFAGGPSVTVFLFFVLSVTIFREYITLTPKSPADHQTFFVIYLVFTPLQFALVGVNPELFHQVTGFTPYQVFSLLLPGYVFLVLPGMMAISGDPKRFLERTAKLQLGLIVCVYSLSYAPALLTLDLPSGSAMNEPPPATVLNHLEETVIATLPVEYQPTSLAETASAERELSAPQLLRTLPIVSGKHFQLLFFFILVVQLGDVFQYLWSRASRRYVVAEQINFTRTWGGILGGMMTTALLGVALWYFTPFPCWWQAGLAAMLVALMGFLGSMTMSAVKRDRGVGSYGALIPGHSGFLDRIDSLCFAAPVFYHFVWYFGGIVN